jgi:hypothetical protein
MACKINIDTCDAGEWSRLADQFYDNSVYQTRAYQSVRAEDDGQVLKSITVTDDDRVVLMFHMRIQKVPLTGLKIGYVQSGPLMMRKDGRLDKLSEALDLLHDLCHGKMINILRLNPHIFDDDQGKRIADILGRSKIGRASHVPLYYTMRVSLVETEEQIRGRFYKRWRRDLRQAEERNIEVREGSGNDYFVILKNLYLESKARKGFQGLDAEIFIKTQELMQPHEKANVAVAYIDGKPVTAHATTHLGKVAIGLLAASNEIGLRQGSSYVIWWKVLMRAKEMGMDYYDLGGIDKERNPSVYLFKKHLGGEEIHHIGAYESCSNAVVRLLWHIAEKAYNFIKKKG